MAHCRNNRPIYSRIKKIYVLDKHSIPAINIPIIPTIIHPLSMRLILLHPPMEMSINISPKNLFIVPKFSTYITKKGWATE